MNLLVITDRFPHQYDPYSAAFVKELINYEKYFFDQVYVISLNPWLPSFIAKRLNNPRWYRDSIATDYSYDNVSVYFAKYFTGKGKFFLRNRDATAYKKIKKIIKKNSLRFDIIHAHFVHPSGTAALKIKKEFNKPLIITGHAHDIREYPFMDPILKEKILNALNNADAFITVSRDNADKVRKIGFKGSIEIIPNGFDHRIFHPIDKYECRKRLHLPFNKKIAVSVARLIEIKGYDYLIQCVKKIVKSRKDILFVIVGEGPVENNLQQMIRDYVLSDYIKMVGAKPHEEIPLWINAADIFVLPSLDEGNPTVMFESLGCGIPFVGTKVGGVPEIITSEDYGLLCEPRDVDCLVKNIRLALDKEWNREKIVKYAQQFTWEGIADRTLKIYQRVLNYSNH